MKILFILPSAYIGGPAGARIIQRLASGLSQCGIKSEVLCCDGNAYGIEYHKDENGIEYSILDIGLLAKAKGLFSRALADRVLYSIKERAITHVWFYNPYWNYYRYAMRTCVSQRVKVIAHLVEWWPFKWHLRWMYIDQELFIGRFKRHLDGIVAISRPWHEFAQSNGIPSVIIPVPCPRQKFRDPILQLKTSGDQKVLNLFYAGQLYRRDMPETMLAALRLLLSKNVDFILNIGGKMDIWPEARSFRKKVESDILLKKKVNFLGFLTDIPYQQQLEQSDAFLLLHDNSWESKSCFPTRLGEYLCAKKPVIVSGVGDIPIYLKDRQNAYVLDPEDQLRGLCAALLHIVNESNQAYEIGLEGEKAAMKMFGEDTLGAKLATFLKDIK